MRNTAGRAQIGGSLCALKDGRCYPTGRRVRVCKAQLIPDDDKGALVVLALPIWKCRAVDLKREALVRLVDDVGAKMSQASRYNRFVFVNGYPTRTWGGQLQ